MVMALIVVPLVAVSTIINLRATARAVDSERRAREDAAAQSRATGEVVRQAFCTMVIAQENVFSDATSKVGKNAADAWHDLGILFRCY
jgi:cytochrome c5